MIKWCIYQLIVELVECSISLLRGLFQWCSAVERVRLRMAFPHLFAQITIKHGCDLTDVLATRRFALLVKSLQWNKKIQCGNSCRRMLAFFEQFGIVFFCIWCRNGVPRPLSALHHWASSKKTWKMLFLAFVRYQQNRRQQVLNREAWHSKIL